MLKTITRKPRTQVTGKFNIKLTLFSIKLFQCITFPLSLLLKNTSVTLIHYTTKSKLLWFSTKTLYCLLFPLQFLLLLPEQDELLMPKCLQMSTPHVTHFLCFELLLEVLPNGQYHVRELHSILWAGILLVFLVLGTEPGMQ